MYAIGRDAIKRGIGSMDQCTTGKIVRCKLNIEHEETSGRILLALWRGFVYVISSVGNELPA